MTFYRKYRPQLIEELDNEEIRRRLSAVLSSKSLPGRQAGLPHAFLFTGPKGTGKTSAARIIAKSINCELRTKDKKQNTWKVEGPRAKRGRDTWKVNYEPCNQCDICKSITNGTCLDVLEIDAASNRGIEEIRSLREKIRLAPSVCKYKVYVIDEVHMLTTEAFNALLKTLEEPPEHAVFILCTTEPRKLPETITSRCLRFNFKRATLSELERSLRRIVAGEKLKIDDPSLHEIARGSDGSFREAAKILEQLSFENKEITINQVLEFLGKIKINQADDFLKFLADRDTKGAILWINSALQNGADLKIINTDLLEILRNYLIKKATGVEAEEVIYGEVYKKLTLEEIKKLIEIFSQAYFELRTTIIPQLPLELGAVEWGTAKAQNSPSASAKTPEENTDKKTGTAKVQNSPVASAKTQNVKLNFDKVASLWPEILEAIKPLNHSVHAVLKSARPLSIEENTLIIEAFYKFHQERLEEPKVNALLSRVVCDKLGCLVGVKCVLGERKTENLEPRTKDNKTEKVDEDLVKVVEEIFK